MPEQAVVPDCGSCAVVHDRKGATYCWSADPAKAPPPPGKCPTRAHADTVSETLAGYLDESDDARMARVAARVEGLCYDKSESGAVHARWTRVEDTIAFAKLMKYRRVGIATCIGLLEETRRLEQILRAQGLEPRILNAIGTDMNVIVGLCVGHDMLFSKHSEAPVTTLVAKDRVTGHNPATVLYGQGFYYKRLAKVAVPVPEE